MLYIQQLQLEPPDRHLDIGHQPWLDNLRYAKCKKYEWFARRLLTAAPDALMPESGQQLLIAGQRLLLEIRVLRLTTAVTLCSSVSCTLTPFVGRRGSTLVQSSS